MSTSVTPFDRDSKRIVFDCNIEGPLGWREVVLIVDTGAELTTILPDVLDSLGYSARMGDRLARITSAIGDEYTYTIRLQRMRAFGHELPDFLVNAADLAVPAEIDGLVGLNFFRKFDSTIRYSTGEIVLDPIATLDLAAGDPQGAPPSR